MDPAQTHLQGPNRSTGHALGEAESSFLTYLFDCSETSWVKPLKYLSTLIPINQLFMSHSLPGEGKGNPLQYSCLENPMDRGAWRATVHGVSRVRYDLVTESSKSHSLQHYISFFIQT